MSSGPEDLVRYHQECAAAARAVAEAYPEARVMVGRCDGETINYFASGDLRPNDCDDLLWLDGERGKVARPCKNVDGFPVCPFPGYLSYNGRSLMFRLKRDHPEVYAKFVKELATL